MHRSYFSNHFCSSGKLILSWNVLKIFISCFWYSSRSAASRISLIQELFFVNSWFLTTIAALMYRLFKPGKRYESWIILHRSYFLRHLFSPILYGSLKSNRGLSSSASLEPYDAPVFPAFLTPLCKIGCSCNSQRCALSLQE